MGPQGPKHDIFGDLFYSKNVRKLKFHFSLFFHFNARKHMISPFYLKWTEVTRDCKFLKFSLSPWGLTIGTKITIPSEFCPLQVKWWYHMFSSVKKEEYIESELSGLFQVKVAAKNIVFGSLGTQRKAAFAVWCLFLKKHTNILNQTVTLECFLC